jgi:predicted deacetylase
MAFLPAIISIHDVMPDTLSRVESMLTNHLSLFPPEYIVLLVVPGLDWSEEQLDRLRILQQQGYEFAGHGWQHETDGIDGILHSIHSRLISRNAAEHLSYSNEELIKLVTENYRWFARQGFRSPEFYVPPAWALGALTKSDLRLLPFKAYETTLGIGQQPEYQPKWLPLLGFEADTRLRALFLKLWNMLNLNLAVMARRPVRLSIHPYDFEYLISDQLIAILARVEAVSWRSIFNPVWAAETPEKTK